MKIHVVIIEVVTGILLLTAVLVIAAGFVPLSHPWVTRQVCSMITHAGADSCSIGMVKTAAWKSIALQNVAMVVDADSGATWRIKVADAKIHANLPYTLWQLRTDPSTFSKKLLRKTGIISTAAGKQGAEFEVAQKLLSATAKADMRGIALSVSNGMREIVQGTEGAVSVDTDKKETGERPVKVSFRMIRLFGEGFEKFNATVSFTPENDVAVKNCTAKYYDGSIKAHLLIDPDSSRIATCDLAVEKLDLAYWYSVHVPVGKISGIADLTFKGRDMPLQQPLRFSELELVVKMCRLSDLPIQQSLATALFIPSLARLDFSRLTLSASIGATDTIRTEVTGIGDQLSFSTTGWVVYPQGALQQKLQGTFSPPVVKTFPPVVNRTLEVAKNGGRTFRCRLFGTFADPRFELDKELLRRAVGNMFEDFRQELMRQYQVR